MEELPPRTRKAVLLLARHGWYFDLEMEFPQLWELEKALVDGNASKAEEVLEDYFDRRSDEIEKSIVDLYPCRGHLIQAAFRAHRRQEYELSIPVILAQVDGMCKDAIGRYLFIKKDKKPQTALYVEQLVTNEFRSAILSPLAQTLPISAPESERTIGENVLNRHTVLHGESLDYGTKSNSLRAISLINYVAHVLAAEVEDDKRNDEATEG